MTASYQRWNKLFLFCLGLSIAAFLCMKWMETDLWVNDEKFTVIGLELFYPKERVAATLSGLDDRVRTILGYHLHFDFVFMDGIFPGLAAWCMMIREKLNSDAWRKVFFILASVQLLAWAADITENLYLLKWMRRPVIGDEFTIYRFISASKWIIALTAFFSCLVATLLRL